MSTNVNKLKEYKVSLIVAYNDIVSYISAHNSECNLKEAQVKLSRCKEQLTKCFSRLNCQIKVPIEPLAIVCKDDSDEEFLMTNLKIPGLLILKEI